MNCKNCNHPISGNALFCEHCGAKVVKNRITLKNIVADLATTYLGWDNRFLLTVKKMIIKPQDVFIDYFNGVRKRYVNPFTFFAIGAALSLFIYSLFMKSYLDMNEQYVRGQSEMMNKLFKQYGVTNILNVEEQVKNQLKLSEFMVKYFNIISFLSLPLYTLIAFFTYRKNNYGEHLIINAYIQGITFFLVTICFIISSFSSPIYYTLNSFLVMLYYMYSYGKFHKLEFWKSILKFLKFLFVLFVFGMLLMTIGVLIGLLSKFLF